MWNENEEVNSTRLIYNMKETERERKNSTNGSYIKELREELATRSEEKKREI